MRKSNIFLLFIFGNLLVLGLLFIFSKLQTISHWQLLRQEVEVVYHLNITDLCLGTEAGYTRHPSQADRHSAFQSHPTALDHFPSGSIIWPRMK